MFRDSMRINTKSSISRISAIMASSNIIVHDEISDWLRLVFTCIMRPQYYTDSNSSHEIISAATSFRGISVVVEILGGLQQPSHDLTYDKLVHLSPLHICL